jgi:hypothetical protein
VAASAQALAKNTDEPEPSTAWGTPLPEVGQDMPYNGRPRMIRSGSPP